MSEKLIIEVNLTRGDTTSAFKKIEKQGGKSAKKLGDNFEQKLKTGISSALKGFLGLAVITRAVGAFTNQIRESVSALRDFTRSVANVNSILPRNDKLVKDSTETFRNFASSFATTTARQADAFYSIVSAGVKNTANQLETLEIANQAAIAGLVDIDDATKLLVSSVNAYARSGLTATQASDALFAAVREGQTTFRELANFLGNTTSIAFSAGASFQDLAGTLAFVTKAGIQTDRAVIGLRQLFTSVIKVTKQARDEAERLGLQFNTAAIRSKGLAGFLKDVAERTNGSSESLGKLFGNVRALNPVLAVVNGRFSDYQRILRETNNAQGDTAEAAEQIKKSLDFKLDALSSSLDVLIEKIVEKLAPAIIFLADKLTFFFRALSGVEPRLETLERRAESLTKKIKDLEETGSKPFEGLGNGLQRAEARLVGTNNELDRLKTKLAEINEEIAQERLEKLLSTSAVARLTRARAKLQELNQELEKAKEIGKEGDILFSDKQVKNLDEAANKLKQSLSGADLDVRVGRNSEQINSDIEIVKSLIAELEEELTFSIKVDEESTRQEMRKLVDIIREEAEAARKTLENLQKQVDRIFVNGLTRTIVGGIETVVNALATGKDAFAALADFILSSFGDLAIQLGTFYIAQGIAQLAMFSVDPTGTIAAGAGLVALGAILKAFAKGGIGGSSTGSSSISGGGNNVIEPQFLPEPEDVERQTSSEINITVEGSLVQQEELGQFLSDVISESNEKNGNVILNQRFA